MRMLLTGAYTLAHGKLVPQDVLVEDGRIVSSFGEGVQADRVLSLHGPTAFSLLKQCSICSLITKVLYFTQFLHSAIRILLCIFFMTPYFSLIFQ